MDSKQEQYTDMFYAEAFEQHEVLNQLLTTLEKNPTDKDAIEHIFRITHTLKGNAMGLGFDAIAELSHVLEDIFLEIKNGTSLLSTDMFEGLFRANDKLGLLIEAIKSKETVRYKGILTKLKVLHKKMLLDQKDNKDSEAVDLTNDSNQVVQHVESVQKIEESPTESDFDESDAGPSKISFSDQVQIPVKKLDHLLNLAGELIIEKDSIIATHAHNGHSNDFARLHRITSDLQYAVMDVRLVQVGFFFNKFHRVLRDTAKVEGKEVSLELFGTEIEIDRNVLKIISDSLVHLIRNAVSHGIEPADTRQDQAKNPTGKVCLKARNEKDTVIIEITDDGKGIDVEQITKKAILKGLLSVELAQKLSEEEKLMLIFEPGFSSSEQITEISGRGVGMDVVKRSTESIGGRVNVRTNLGKGTTISLLLPSSMAVKGALLFEMKHQKYAIPLSYTEAVISLRKRDIHRVSSGLVSKYLGQTISLVFLHDLFNTNELTDLRNTKSLLKSFEIQEKDKKQEVVVVSYNNRYIGFVVDKLLQQKEIVEKNLLKPLDNIPLFSGATILGDGGVCLVLDVPAIINLLFKESIN